MPETQDILSIGFDWKKTQSDADKVLAQMQRIADAGANVTKSFSVIDISAGFAASKKGAQEVAEAVTTAKKSYDEYGKTVAQTGITQKQKIAIDKAERDEMLAIQKELDKLTAKREKEAAAKKASADIPFTTNLNADGTVIEPATTGATTAVNELDLAQAEAANSATALGQAQLTAAEGINVAKKSTEQLRIEEERDLKIKVEDKLLASQRTAELKNQVREENSVKGSLEQRRAALIRLSSAYDKLSATERESGYGQRLQSVVSGLSTQVKTLEGETGRAQRNVGNYGNAITKAFSGAFGYLRQIAYIVPGIGIAGLLGGIVEAVTSMVSKLVDGTDAIKKFSKEEIAERKSIANSMGDEIGKITYLKAALDSENVTREDKKRAIKELIELQPKYFGGLKLEGDTVVGLGTAYDAYTASILKTAKAKASLAVLQDFYKKRLDLELQATEDLTKVEQKFQDFQKRQVEAFQKGKIAPVQVFSRDDRANIKLIADIQEVDMSIKDVIKTISESDIDIDAVIGGKKGKADKHVKTITESIAELRQELKAIKSEQDNGVITISEADNKRIEKYKSTIEEIFKLKASDKDKNAAAFKLSVELNPISIRIMERQIKDFKDKTEKDRFLKLLPPIDKTKQYLDEQTKAYEDSINQRQAIASKDFSLQQSVLLANYALGKLTKKQYEQQLLDIQEDFAEKSIERQIEEYEAELKYAFIGVAPTKENADKRLAIEEKLAAARLALGVKINAKEESDLEKRKQKLLTFLQDVQENFDKVAGILGGVINIKATNEKNRLQEVEDSQQKNYENEVARINASQLTEEQKAIALNNIEKQREAQKERFDRQTREADQKKARFDKQVAIMNIVLSTAAAVIKALPNIPLSILAGVLGAAQLAVAIATPIPKYAKGVKNKPTDGLGIAGEAGWELVERPGYAPQFVGNETLMHMPKGTNVVPIGRDEINGVMYRAMARRTAETMNMNDSKPDISEMLLRELISVTKKGKSPVVVKNIFKNGSTWRDYENKYFGRG